MATKNASGSDGQWAHTRIPSNCFQPGPALAGAPAFMPSKPSMLLGELISPAPLQTISKKLLSPNRV